MKALLREMVLSATYRQSAKTTPELSEKDPRNRFLARGPSQRLTAEMVRDQALLASGLLNLTMGGPPVMPPQPPGVWNSVYNESKWVDAKGRDRYRRAIYTYIKRTSGYPSFLTFDASDHDTSLARRIPTNTPLQALVTLNDPVYAEASEALADRMRRASANLDGQLQYGARLVLSRELTENELATLRRMLERAHPSVLASREELQLVHRNSMRLLKLVNNLLDFSRIEAGGIQVLYEPTDLSVLTADTASAFRSAMELAGLEFVTDCPPLSEPAYVDRDMWEKIVLNLVSNAFKFTPSGKVTVRLRAAGARIELTVEDTGLGIPEDQRSKIFERFHRLEAASSRTHEGTGIGLALVQELVKLHKGSIVVESKLGKGSTFMVSLPMGRAHLPADRVGSQPIMRLRGASASAYVDEALRWLPETDRADGLGLRVFASDSVQAPHGRCGPSSVECGACATEHWPTSAAAPHDKAYPLHFRQNHNALSFPNYLA